MNRKAFTLIELLIVVAIIAILAAIAVPNFLEAQTRSKVSRVKSDMRTLAIPTEAYRVDNNRYATPSDEAAHQGGTVPYGSNLLYFETKTSALITTPIAYITSRFYDVFIDDEAGLDGKEKIIYHYATRAYSELNGALPTDQSWNEYIDNMRYQPSNAEYYFLSHGPDNHHDGPDESHPVCYYDPTNGTISIGDVIYVGPSQGFK
jgi:prepilin-type N-terminal cleavage/methylation domain-containing protein